MRQVRVGDKVRCLVTECDVVAGREYPVTYVSDGDGYVEVRDEDGDNYVLLECEYIFTPRESSINDITGDGIFEGDTIAYAFSGFASKHLALFEVQQINGPTALCRSKVDCAIVTLGVFEERAIIVK